jgi:deazaflavin-dependent oxidoreductase (nitroreductase family)
MSVTPEASPRLPPPWFIRAAWRIHRGVYRLTGGRLGLWRPTAGKWGALRLHTTGRRSGAERVAILGYYEDGPNLVTMAMNGWMDGEPAWWLNLQQSPLARIELADESRQVRARAAEGEERSRLWAMLREQNRDLDALARRRSSETAIVILEPVHESADP